MPLSEETKALYRILDSTTLLALLPELRLEAARVKRELKMWTDSADTSRESDTQLAELAGEYLAVIESQVPADDFSRLRGLLNEKREAVAFDPDRHRSTIGPIFKVLMDLTERDRWIVDELKRRGLLPGEPSVPD